MPAYPVTRRHAALLGGLLLVVACGDSDYRIEKLDTGLSVDSAMAVLSDGSRIDSTRMPPPGALVPSSDTLKNVWKREEFLMFGSKIEVLYYSPTNEKWKAGDSVPKEKVIPVIFVDGKLYGTGRDAYDRARDRWSLPPLKF